MGKILDSVEWFGGDVDDLRAEQHLDIEAARVWRSGQNEPVGKNASRSDDGSPLIA